MVSQDLQTLNYRLDYENVPLAGAFLERVDLTDSLSSLTEPTRRDASPADVLTSGAANTFREIGGFLQVGPTPRAGMRFTSCCVGHAFRPRTLLSSSLR